MDVKPVPRSAVLETYGLVDGSLTVLESGLIHASWRIDTPAGDRFVLQRVNPIFPATVNADIDAVTKHLREKGVLTPLIVPTPSGDPALTVDGEVWRLLTYIPGKTRDFLDNPRQAGEAGRRLARFHRALSDLEHDFSNPRLGVHDTAAHLKTLERVLAVRGDHPLFPSVEPLAERILEMAGAAPELPISGERIVHGDPKISNFVFDEITDEAVCLIDLDTVSSMPVILELGDAFRSWCNPLGEDTRETVFSEPLFRSAVGGYARQAGDFLSADQWRAVPAATLTITLELAARFAADALEERYFGWDPDRYRTAGEHNRVRAAGQLRLAESIRAQWSALRAAVER